MTIPSVSGAAPGGLSSKARSLLVVLRACHPRSRSRQPLRRPDLRHHPPLREHHTQANPLSVYRTKQGSPPLSSSAHRITASLTRYAPSSATNKQWVTRGRRPCPRRTCESRHNVNAGLRRAAEFPNRSRAREIATLRIFPFAGWDKSRCSEFPLSKLQQAELALEELRIMRRAIHRWNTVYPGLSKIGFYLTPRCVTRIVIARGRKMSDCRGMASFFQKSWGTVVDED